jgi:mycothiol system anti-sigma-R factor
MTMRAIVASSCRALSPAVETYLDGELDPSHVVDVEAHLAECPPCREKVALHRAVRVSLRRVAVVPAPTSLRDRVRLAMEAEARRVAEEAADATPLPAPANVTPLPQVPQARASASTPRVPRSAGALRARYVIPFAAAASVAFAISTRQPPSMSQGPAATAADTASPSLYNSASITGLDGVVDDLVSAHAQPVPPEVTGQDEMRKFDPFVGVPVEPPKFQPLGAKWLGGRMMPMRDYRAAMMQYTMAGGHRVTVYVYDPRRVRQESAKLRERSVRGEPMFYGNVRGYNVAATERKGIGYAVASDLDEPESMELVAAGMQLARGLRSETSDHGRSSSSSSMREKTVCIVSSSGKSVMRKWSL